MHPAKISLRFLSTVLLLAALLAPAARAETASLVVTTAADIVADDGQTSLREAWAYAATLGGAQTVTFAPALAGQTIALGAAGDQTFGPSALRVVGNVTIDGGTGGVTIARDATAQPTRLRLFYVPPGATLTLKNLTVRDGLARGGSAGSGGGGAGLGGAIVNAGTLNLVGATLTANQALGGNGGGSNGGGGGLGGDAVGLDGGAPNGATGTADAGFGGGGSTLGFTGGQAGFGGGGSGPSGSGLNGGFGGGGSGGLSDAGFGGGGYPGTFHFTGTGGGGMGGAVFNYGGTVNAINTTLAANTAKGGTGGIAGSGYGGAIFNLNGTVTTTNATLSGNVAAQGGGAIFDLGANGIATQGGPALTATTASAPARVTMHHTILAGSHDGAATPALVSDYFQTVIAGFVASGGAGNLVQTRAAAANDFAGTAATADPLLGALASNGGPTPTLALVPGSPALDAGANVTTLASAVADGVTPTIAVADASAFPAGVGAAIQVEGEQMIVTGKSGNVLTVARGASGSVAAAHPSGAGVNPATDQRGIVRAGQGAGLDIGAYEARQASPVLQLSQSVFATDGSSTVVTATPSGGVFTVLDASSAPVSGVLSGVTLRTTVPGGYTLRYTVTSADGIATTASAPFTVVPPLVLTAPASVPPYWVSVSFQNPTVLTITGGVAPFTVVAGATTLPTGMQATVFGGSVELRFTPAPTTAGSFPSTVTVEDAAGQRASANFTVAVSDQNPVEVSTPPNTIFYLYPDGGTFPLKWTETNRARLRDRNPADISSGGIQIVSLETDPAFPGGIGNYLRNPQLLPDGLDADGIKKVLLVYSPPSGAPLPTPGTYALRIDYRYYGFTFADTNVTVVVLGPRGLGQPTRTAWTRNRPGFTSAVPIVNALPLDSQNVISELSGLPAGLSGAVQNGQVVLTGTPTQSGSFPVTLTVVNNAPPNLYNAATTQFTLTINVPPSLGSLSPTTAAQGVPYTGRIPIANGTPPFSIGGSIALPPGLIVAISADGLAVELIGTPTVRGTFSSIGIAALDSAGAAPAAFFTLTVTEAPSLVVTTAADVVADDGLTSLREAIAFANSGTAGANPVITFDATVFAAAQTITLGGTQLSITRSVTITGPAAGVTVSGGNASRLLQVGSGQAVTLRGLTLAQGKVRGFINTDTMTQENGGGIYNGGNLTLDRCVVRDCRVIASFRNFGGGIYNAAGATLLVRASTLSGNSAVSGGENLGGAIYNAGTVTLSGSTLSGNLAGEGRMNRGGGLYSAAGLVTLIDSTVSGNTVRGVSIEGAQNGAGISNAGTLLLANCTVAANAAAPILHPVNDNQAFTLDTYDLDLDRAVISLLDGNVFPGPQAIGGGIFNEGTATLANALAAANTSTGSAPDVAGNVTANFSFIGDPAGATISGGNHSSGDARLGPLASYGGPTQTHALLSGSPALDTGSSALLPADTLDLDGDLDTTEPIPTDQRGQARVRGAAVDIGAFEAAPAKLYVDQGVSGGDGTGSSWVNAMPELRTALTDPTVTEVWVAAGTYRPAAVASGDRAATFRLRSGLAIYGGFTSGQTQLAQRDAHPGTNGTILSGDLDGDDGPTFAGNGENSLHVVTGSGTDATARLDGFTIRGGNANTGTFPANGGGGMLTDAGSPTLANLTFNGNSGLAGGGLLNLNGSNATLTEVVFSGNAGTNGGGMQNRGSLPTLTRVIFLGNTAGNGPGMLNINGGDATLTDVNFRGNISTNGQGGALYNSRSNPTLTNVTVSGNSAPRGGGMYCFNDSRPVLTNVTFSGNVATFEGGAIFTQDGIVTLTNVTVTGNAANSGGALFYGTGSTVLRNCIFWDNNTGGAIVDGGGGTLTATNSLVQQASGVFPGAGNLNADPLFRTPIAVAAPTTTGDLRLRAGSPAIDTGSNTVASPALPATDLDGNARIFNQAGGGIVDMGAFEFIPSNALPTFSGYAFTNRAGTWTTVAKAKILARAADSDGGTLSIVSVASFSAQGNTVADVGDGIRFRIATPGFRGLDSFNVLISDGQGGTVTAPIGVNVLEPGSGLGLNLVSLTVLPNGHVALLFMGIPGQTYRIERSTDLQVWTPLQDVIATPDGALPFTDPAPPPGDRAFYRTAVDY